ncbi:hypothetical protein ACHWQZ_G006982 [Mnemiopsis leidyi]
MSDHILLLLLLTVATSEDQVYYHPTKPGRCGSQFSVIDENGRDQITGCKTSPELPVQCCSRSGHCGLSELHCSCTSCKKYNFYERLFISRSEFVTVKFPEGGTEVDCSAALERKRRGFLNQFAFEQGEEMIFTTFTCFGETAIFLKID